jgi:hypothetical protein
MQAARAKAIWYGHSMLTRVDKLPLLGRSDAREPDASRYAALSARRAVPGGVPTNLVVSERRVAASLRPHEGPCRL